MTESSTTTYTDPRNAVRARNVAITGAGGGIGRTVAEAFRSSGWRLTLIDSGRNEEGLRDTFPEAVVVSIDLSDASATAAAFGGVSSQAGFPDALVHLAGGFATAEASATDSRDLAIMFDRNLGTLHAMVRAVLPAMLERKRGSIVGIAARQALQGGRNVTAYAAAKGAVLGYLRALRAEVGPSGINVGTVVPMGTIDTPANRRVMPNADPSTWIAAAEMADACVYLAERGPRGRVSELRVGA